MSARLPGTSSAAPTPWTARAAISRPTVGAAAQAPDAAANSATPHENTRRLPNRSPSAPPTSTSAASKSAYASTIHCAAATEAPSSRCMTGSATLTTVPSRNAMLDPRMATTSAQRGSRGGDTHGPHAALGTAASNIRYAYPFAAEATSVSLDATGIRTRSWNNHEDTFPTIEHSDRGPGAGARAGWP